MAVLTTSSLQLSRHAVQQEANSHAASLRASFAALVTNATGDLPGVIASAAQAPVVQSAVQRAGSDPVAIQADLDYLVWARPDLATAFVTDAAGNVTATSPRKPGKTFANLANTDWFRGATATNGAYLSQAYLPDDPSLGLVVSLALRITSPARPNVNQTVGFLVAVYRLAPLQADVDRLRLNQGAAVTITDQSGTVLISPGRQQSSVISMAKDPRVTAALHGGSGTQNRPGPNGGVISAYGSVTNPHWAIIVDISRAQAFADYRRLEHRVVAIAGLLGLLLLVALYLAGRSQHRRRSADTEADWQARALAASEQRFRAAFLHAPVGVVRLDRSGVIREVNKAFCDLIGAASLELLGNSFDRLQHPDDVASHPPTEVGVAVQRDRPFLRPDGETIWALASEVVLTDETGECYRLIQAVDISDRKRTEDKLNRQALHDALTGLPNRLLLESRIEHALSRYDRHAEDGVAVLFVDLDGFKEVNDQLGHRLGDEVLREICCRLKHVVRPGDTVARLGGDEFVVLCEQLHGDGVEAAEQVARRILKAVNQPGTCGASSWQVSASVGISRPGPEATTAVALISHADAAMYRAKQEGKNRVAVYEPSMGGMNAVSPRAIGLVESAFDQDRLRLYYQPVFDLRTRTIVGAESLIRMVDDDGGILAPHEFLEAAQAHGQIVDFGAWTIRTACAHATICKSLLPAGADFSIAVNMSPKEIEGAGFLDRIDAGLAMSGLNADALIVELTESAFLRDLPAGRQSLKGLRDRGIGLALDDFGTGFSSLSYLRRFGVDIIKLDRSFVADLLDGGLGSRVTRGLIALAHTLEVHLVAEGVETEAQAQELVELGAHLAQGYLLARPMDADSFIELLVSSRSASAGSTIVRTG